MEAASVSAPWNTLVNFVDSERLEDHSKTFLPLTTSDTFHLLSHTLATNHVYDSFYRG